MGDMAQRSEREVRRLNIKDVADYAAEFMKGQGVVVQRYDATSTKSIYIKFDYGLAHTMRISDHTGIEHLHYKYNLRTDVDEYYSEGTNTTERHYFPLADIDHALKMILLSRFSRIGKWGMAGYKAKMSETAAHKAASKNRFWQSCTYG